jgi:hypothetical protein
VHAQDQDAHRRGAADDLSRRFDTIEQWHPDVENRDVRIELDGLANGVAPVAGFGNDTPIATILENLSESLTQHGVIVAEQDA